MTPSKIIIPSLSWVLIPSEYKLIVTYFEYPNGHVKSKPGMIIINNSNRYRILILKVEIQIQCPTSKFFHSNNVFLLNIIIAGEFSDIKYS